MGIDLTLITPPQAGLPAASSRLPARSGLPARDDLAPKGQEFGNLVTSLAAADAARPTPGDPAEADVERGNPRGDDATAGAATTADGRQHVGAEGQEHAAQPARGPAPELGLMTADPLATDPTRVPADVIARTDPQPEREGAPEEGPAAGFGVGVAPVTFAPAPVVPVEPAGGIPERMAGQPTESATDAALAVRPGAGEAQPGGQATPDGAQARRDVATAPGERLAVAVPPRTPAGECPAPDSADAILEIRSERAPGPVAAPPPEGAAANAQTPTAGPRDAQSSLAPATPPPAALERARALAHLLRHMAPLQREVSPPGHAQNAAPVAADLPPSAQAGSLVSGPLPTDLGSAGTRARRSGSASPAVGTLAPLAPGVPTAGSAGVEPVDWTGESLATAQAAAADPTTPGGHAAAAVRGYWNARMAEATTDPPPVWTVAALSGEGSRPEVRDGQHTTGPGAVPTREVVPAPDGWSAIPAGLPPGAANTPAGAASQAVMGPDGLADEHGIVPQVVKAIHLQWRQGLGEARLRLDPAHLGEVQVTLRVQDGAVSALLRAETPAAQAWIDARQQELRSALEHQGLRLEHFEVIVDPDGRRDANREQLPFARPRPARTRGDAPRFEVNA